MTIYSQTGPAFQAVLSHYQVALSLEQNTAGTLALLPATFCITMVPAMLHVLPH